MLLYEHPLSSYAQKVKIALREKGVAFDLELPESFGTGREDGAFAEANPRAEVPVLIDGDLKLFESTVILEYVEERWPAPAPAAARPRRPGAGAADRGGLRHAIRGGELGVRRDPVVSPRDRRAGRAHASDGRAPDRSVAGLARRPARHRGLVRWRGLRLGGRGRGAGPQPLGLLRDGARRGQRARPLACAPARAPPRWHRPSPSSMPRRRRWCRPQDMYTTGGRRREYRDHRLEWVIKSGGLEIVQAGLRDENIRFPWPNPL